MEEQKALIFKLLLKINISSIIILAPNHQNCGVLYHLIGQDIVPYVPPVPKISSAEFVVCCLLAKITLSMVFFSFDFLLKMQESLLKFFEKGSKHLSQKLYKELIHLK